MSEEKIEQVGSIQELTHKLFEQFMAQSNLKAGDTKVSSSELYTRFIKFLEASGYTIVPSTRAVGRAISKRLPHVKTNKGTCYMVSTIEVPETVNTQEA